ncbi:Gp37Gp68 family protein [Methylocaldum marinum]|uniref:Gp37Gp68 family protein n=1 Tax=Methylocaldum marinum TaxID=1432792 RepID=A0A250KTS8_9GAMM|nr:phage Gp37/Gp68 family protein [Methylocaldum marinum]BBA35083.1 Gp37Gp68 family protein [Methylocaldum marinum]
MSGNSKIEWTEQTWNPTVGCTKVSPGCKNCYAESMALRLQAMGLKGYENGFRLSLRPERLLEPLGRRKPTIYFVNSMSDLFHEKVPFDYVARVFDIMREAEQHTFQVLTKRAERMAAFCAGREIPPNIWLGVSVENKRHGLPRIDALRNVNATIRFLSIEPLLEDLGHMDLTGIHWVIVGGESGSRARPMRAEWVDNVRRQCLNANVAFFFKQWGAWGADGQRRSKKANGRSLGGQVWDAMPA